MGCDLSYTLQITQKQLFQFTHPRGVRQAPIAVASVNAVFQFTHPRGVRRDYVGRSRSNNSISIHTPTWGATFDGKVYYGRESFQFTHPRGVRLCQVYGCL